MNVDSEQKEVYSFSRLSSFQDCPAGWFQNYVLNKPKEPNSYASKGSFCHDIMEDYANGKITREDALERFNLGWFEVEPKLPVFKGYHLEDTFYKKIFKFFDREQILEGETISVEDDITTPLPSGALIRGKLDRVFLKDEKVYVSDYKISTPFTIEKIKTKRRQLDLYAYLLHAQTGEYPDYIGWIYFKDHTKNKFLKFDKKKMEETIQWCEDTITEIKARLTLVNSLGVKGLFNPNYNERIDEKTGTRDRFCLDLCGYGVNNSCPFVDGDYLKMFKAPDMQELQFKK